ncbi:hypothetical protein BH24DEI2_BH24DEI2_16370 [soil metagenome]
MKRKHFKQPRSKRFIDKYFWHGIVAVVLVGALANLYIWFSPRETQALELPSYPVEQVVQGRDIYQANCAACHGENQAGNAAANIPALDGSMHAWHHADAQIAGFIRGGVGAMPAVGADWSDTEVEAVLAYLKQAWEPEQLAYQTESSRQNP